MKQKKLINTQLNLRNKFLKQGVQMIAPETVFFSKNTKIGKNVTIEPYVVIADKVSIFRAHETSNRPESIHLNKKISRLLPIKATS